MSLKMNRKKMVQSLVASILCLTSVHAVAHEDHAPQNPKYQTKILKNKAERLSYDTILALKAHHWKTALHDTQLMKKTLRKIWYIHQHC
ncbi:hypothetical protein [Acidithiobacillus concretivorus]|uniref:Uncharacterized protein n=1 Tax=Acidithiobacillus concretivorus TaxID=3063952 RepID=A0ABS5ZSV3_9PROT|nr:hypothetical protein [Acidithiobacillus concretivorus]MBU2739676.1 hypothetical protein [Acidithiobacillus concretivorus]